MMGEWSKKLGEHGEDIVEALMNLIGWKSSLKGTDLECVKPTIHGSPDKHRRTHGVDFIFSCISPLEDNVLKHLLISSKFKGDPYPPSPASTFKDYFVDLAMALECFKRSSKRKQINTGYQQVSSDSISGVLFWLSGTDNTDADIIQKVANARGLDDFAYGTIYVVDNYRASFLFDSITYVNGKHGSDNVKFVYPSTGKNISATSRITTGKVLPPEFINSGIIPFYANVLGHKTLIICCQDPFNEDALKRLIGFSITIALEFPDKILLAFPDYDFVKHKETIEVTKLTLVDKEFASIVEVVSYQKDFRGIAE